ncbi:MULTISPECIES: hypothetical protein [unclassified Streptomyces]|uniref:hypothetical protein n=1 Tax=unclassified Streptomyces TaxID=2593676 RepID=UPI00224CE435|nr:MULTISPECIES: hypothetical protein [unclassified Streptomyces]MCX5048125.1 hypothetical protein [Streptomyces sp. NBC_00474]MCX5057146.1 hypothetical protein [Streptomyces sp. NBC_00452]MCX5245975.1 hypothetical protein [Streptomyces sp. NBC_00201]MCX5288221.1 hypothetical protein [Streptomyces sp. NBC_00183]
MAESSSLLRTALQEHLNYYRALSKHLPDLDGDVIAAAHDAIRELTSRSADADVPCAAYLPVTDAVAAAVEYCEFTGHSEGVRYYRYWHTLLLADQALCD